MDKVSQVIEEALVIENLALNKETFLITLKTTAIAKMAKAGQCVKLRAWAPAELGGSPFLDRPFSIHKTGPGGSLSVLYRVVGAGTLALSLVQKGQKVKLSGPFGHSFPEAVKSKIAPKFYLVAGGLGLAPMGMVKDLLGAGSTIFYGEKSGQQQVPKPWLEDWAEKDFIATCENGDGYGRKGLVTLPLKEALEQERRPIFTCGPIGMMAAVVALASDYGVKAWVSVEARMACGFGICLTCSLALKNGERIRACQEGPVYDGKLIDWSRLK